MQRSYSKQKEIHFENAKMYLKLSAVDRRTPIYSKETIPTMPPHSILVQEKPAAPSEFRPTLNFQQRVRSHQHI